MATGSRYRILKRGLRQEQPSLLLGPRVGVFQQGYLEKSLLRGIGPRMSTRLVHRLPAMICGSSLRFVYAVKLYAAILSGK